MMGLDPIDMMVDYLKFKGNTIIGMIMYPIIAPLILLFLLALLIRVEVWKLQKFFRNRNK
jgi:hypothetical protein